MADGSSKCVRDERNVCELCGALEHLSLCGGCRKTWYCCKEHQKADWREHKKKCSKKKKVIPDAKDTCVLGSGSKAQVSTNRDDSQPAGVHTHNVNTANKEVGGFTISNSDQGGDTDDSIASASVQVPAEGSSEAYILQTEASSLSSEANVGSLNMPSNSNPLNSSEPYVTVLRAHFQELAKYVVDCLNKYGICVIDKFLGESKGKDILDEVKHLHSSGVFRCGQVGDAASVSSTPRIRGDMITWVDGSEDGCENILFLIACMDHVILQCAGKLQDYKIAERTKAMVACYPGKNTGYVRHVDNPNGDGRCVTSIYYLNKDWDVRKYGGSLRIFPEGNNKMAIVEPLFDRLLFFWSDRRNPHEVQNALRERFAITVWYYDTDERARALRKFKDAEKKTAVPLINGERPS